MEPISKENIIKIKEEFEKEISGVKDKNRLEEIRVAFLGRKSALSSILKSVKDLPLEEKKEIGSFANKVRQEMEEALGRRGQELGTLESADKDWFDVTAPGEKAHLGHLNILSQTQKRIEDIFSSMGFEIADGPEIEDEWHNFTALNMPADHPARDMQDTFWLRQGLKEQRAESREQKGKNEELNLLLRTHTSNVQIRYMKTHKPPVRIIVPGRVFRNESTDARHEHTFYQFEALVVDKEISVANFKHIAKMFFDAYFQADVNIRLRPSYFPFTEPSFEFDMSCMCKGKGCPVCKGTGWVEIGGAGMVNQRVFEAAGYKRGEYQGFAWGFGIARLAMLKHKIDDGRLFMSGDLRFIRQF